MKTTRVFLVSFCLFTLFSGQVCAQQDSLPKSVRDKVISIFKNFQIGFYIDAYYVKPIGESDTANIIPFSSNCPFANEIRMNVASMWIKYNSDRARGHLAIQYGDAPMLLTKANERFIKYLRQANFGFRIYKELWVDFGYMLDPIGVESSWPVINQLSTVTVGGYYEPGSFLGVKLSYTISDKLFAALYVCNPYSLAYGKNTSISLAGSLSYMPVKRLNMTYSFLFGNQALKGDPEDKFQLYNNLVVNYLPYKWLNLTAQLDYAVQGNSVRLNKEGDGSISLYSGFIQSQFIIIPMVSVSLRGEFFADPNAMLSSTYLNDDLKKSGLKTWGLTGGAEFKPIDGAYFRVEYRYLSGNKNDMIFYGRGDTQQTITVTTGLKF